MSRFGFEFDEIGLVCFFDSFVDDAHAGWGIDAMIFELSEKKGVSECGKEKRDKRLAATYSPRDLPPKYHRRERA